MLAENMEIGLPVRIKKDISLTHSLLDSNSTMRDMAGSQKRYTIENVSERSSMTRSGTFLVAEIKGYIWMPEDLLWEDEPGYVEDILLNGDQKTFDPDELYTEM